MVMQSKTKVNNIDITYNVEQEIFKALPVTPPATNLLYTSVSVVNTYYNMSFANSGLIMPPGSATLINIGDSPLNNIVYTHPSATTAKPSDVTVQYMIQASPGKSGSGELISRDVLSNSVMNSLILAAINKVEYIIFPFIGGELFYKELERVEIQAGRTHSKNKHAEILVKGVTDFYDFIEKGKSGLTNTVKEIYFSPWGEIEKNALIDAKRNASTSKKNIGSVLKVSSGTKNLIDETIDLIHKGTRINAIVNAANVELSFGSGISSMCYAAIGENHSKQTELHTIRDTFISAFKQYIKQKNSESGTSGITTSTSVPTSISAPTSTSISAPTLMSVTIPAPAPALSPPSPKKPAIKEINGINRRATVQEFIDAQEKGINGGAKIPGGVNDSITYSVTGSTFVIAISVLVIRYTSAKYPNNNKDEVA